MGSSQLGESTANLLVLMPWWFFRRRHPGGLPNNSRLNYLEHVMTKDFVGLERNQFGVLDSRVLELFPVATNARHAWQCATHFLWPLQTPYDDAISIIIE